MSSILLFFSLLLFQHTTHASQQTITPIQDKVPVYDIRDDALTVMGLMRADAPLVVTGDAEEFWQVKFGNGYGYIKKDMVHQTGELSDKAINKQKPSNLTVHIQKNVDVYDNSTGQLVKIAILLDGFRYPVLKEYGNWWQIDVGGRTGFIYKSATTIDSGIPVLMYHHFLSEEEKADSPFADKDSTMIDTKFNEQMDYLKDNGFTTISVSDLEEYLDRKINLPSKAVLITIDDGNISTRIYAYPKLKEHGFIAEQFIITSRTPKTPATFNHQTLHFLSQQEMDEMSDVYHYSAHTHALHSVTENNKGYLIEKDAEEVREDLLLNRSLLNDTTYLAYPFGHYSNEAIQLVKEAGFTMAFTTNIGRPKHGVNKLLLPRKGIGPAMPIDEFAEAINN